MKSIYANQMPDSWLDLLASATEIVKYIPRDPSGAALRCHEVARVVHAILGKKKLRVVDGVYNMNSAHTWLEIEPHVVLDVYCIESLPQVQLRDELRHAQQSYVAKKLWKKQGGHDDYEPNLRLVEILVKMTKEQRAKKKPILQCDEKVKASKIVEYGLSKPRTLKKLKKELVALKKVAAS